MVILEIQKSNNGTVAFVGPFHKADPDEADSFYCAKRSSAAISKVDLHTVVLMTDDGKVVEKKTYEHSVPPDAE